MLLVNRRPGRLGDEDEAKTGVGLMEADPAKDDLKRKNWLRDEDSVVAAAAATELEIKAADGRKRLLNGAVRLLLLLLIEAVVGEMAELALSLLAAAPVKGGRLGLVGKGGRGRWVNGLMAGTKVRLRVGAERRVVIRPPPSNFDV